MRLPRIASLARPLPTIDRVNTSFKAAEKALATSKASNSPSGIRFKSSRRASAISPNLRAWFAVPLRRTAPLPTPAASFKTSERTENISSAVTGETLLGSFFSLFNFNNSSLALATSKKFFCESPFKSREYCPVVISPVLGSKLCISSPIPLNFPFSILKIRSSIRSICLFIGSPRKGISNLVRINSIGSVSNASTL